MIHNSRLLHQITPHEYDMLFKPDLTTFTFTGKETITFTLKQPTKEIHLHAKNLLVTKAVLLEGNKQVEAEISYDQSAMFVTLTFPKKVAIGEKQLQLTFSGEIGEKLKGWYRSAYTVNGQTRHMATTQFEEIGAREVFPSIDDPMAKAVFHITLVIPSHLTAISNTIDTKVTEHENGYKTVTFAPTPKMATYALAMVVGEFEYLEKKTPGGVTVRVFTAPGKKSQAQFALDTAVTMLPFYEEYFGIPYPLPILDLIAIPDFDAGAMENWGAITAREVALLVDEETSTAGKQWVAIVIAHEIAHMWFGNLVTMQWWNDLWLNEGFASFIEYWATDKLFPQWHMWEQFALLDHNRALGLDSLVSTHPIEATVTTVEEAKENFDEISYSKGASVIYMLVTYLGEKDFQKGLQRYLKKFAYGNATTQDLWEVLEGISGKPVKKIMASYTQKSGHPYIQISQKQNELYLEQNRFFLNPLAAKKTQENTLWQIPLKTLSSETLLNKDYLMDNKHLIVPSPVGDNWIKFNSGETTLVRVLYPQGIYANLEKAIIEKALSAVDRMGIVRDVFDGAEAGYIATATALSFSRSFQKEDAYIVWATLLGKLEKVENILSDTGLLDRYHQFVRPIFSSIAETLGWEKKPRDTHNDILLRSTVLYAYGKYGDSKTVAKAKKLFEDYVTTKKPIETDVRGMVYMLVAENGGEKEFEILKNMYSNEPSHQERNRISNALSNFKQPKLIQQALAFSLSEHVRLQDMGRFTLLGFENPRGREITWQFVKDNWEKLYKKHLGQHGMSWLIEGAGSASSLKLKNDIEAFFKDKKVAQIQRTIQQVLEQIEAKHAWLNRDKEKIARFLSNKV